ncbi:MAG: fibro-slime domain-containing protein [Clostridiales Family XIII bacterium]|jgi:fibro-slime domain-containing protein|nr:fibro-slime domain-containing protein [Clostridiales Family XIII bacterium]
MRKLMNVKRAKRMLAVLVAIAMLSNLPLLAPGIQAPANAAEDAAQESGPSMRELYADIPNGTIMEDGGVLLYYSLWDFEARYRNALYYGNLFDPETVQLPFETETAREEFLKTYRDGSWYLLDVVYSARLMPSPEDSPSDDEIAALLAQSSFAYVVKSGDSGLISVILSSKGGEEFQVHIEADEDGEALGASLVSFEEVLIPVETGETPEALEEIPAEQDAPSIEEGIGEGGSLDEPGEAVNDEAPDSDSPAAGEAPADSDSPADGEAPADSDSPAAGEAPASNDSPADSEAPAGGDSPAPSGGQESESSLISVLKPFFVATAYAGDSVADSPASGDSPAAGEGAASGDGTAAGEGPASDDSPVESEGPASDDSPAESEGPASGDSPADSEAPANGDSPAAGEGADPADKGAEDAEAAAIGGQAEAGPVATEGSLSESKEVLAVYSDELNENIEAKPLAALEIKVRDVSSAKAIESTGALPAPQAAAAKTAGTALKSALASMGASEVYGAEGDDNIRHFPVNLYDYMGTLVSGSSDRTKNPRSGNNRFSTSYDNFNTPAMLVNTSYNANSTTDFNYDSYSIKRYFLFNQPQVVSTPSNVWQNFNGTANDDTGNNANNRHGHQNRVDASDFAGGITQGIAKPSLGDNGAFEINFATMNGLRLFPAIDSDKLSANKVWIYGAKDASNEKNGTQRITAAGSNPGMIQAYPNRQMPFVKGADGYYSFDSSRERVYLDGANDGNNKALGRVEDDTNNGFFPFNTNGFAANTNPDSYNFGMSMEIDFVMPKDGEVGGKDMVFEFQGDDDLWVYLDGRLVLDLGGIHDKQSGTINFSTKTVRTLVEGSTAARRALTAGTPYYTGGSSANTGSISQLFSTVVSQDFSDSFKDFSSHKLQLFYMERNPTGSNCKIKFNLPSIEPDKLNVFKFAEESPLDNTGQFEFDVYTADGGKNESELPTSLGADLPGYVTKSSKNIGNGESFTLDIDKGAEKWVRVVERPKPAGGEEEIYSTAYLGAGLGADSMVAGKDSGWIQYEGGDSLFCVNYTRHPIIVYKHEYPSKASAIVGAEFKLYEGSVESNNLVTTLTTKAPDGSFEINNPYATFWKTNPLKADTEYLLQESALPGYAPLPAVRFRTTGSSYNPKIAEVIWNEADGGQLAYARPNGLALDIYNKKLYGSIAVSKTIGLGDARYSQGNPIFVFRLEKLRGGEVVGTQAKYLEFAPDGTEATLETSFSGLELGYSYRISEADVIRYGLEDITVTTAGTGDYSGAVAKDGDSATINLTTANYDAGFKVAFSNAKTYDSYLSDTVVALNSFTHSPTPPNLATDSDAVQVTFKQGSGANLKTVVKALIKGDVVSIEDLTKYGFSPKPKNDGQIGTVAGGGQFFLTTPIPGACTITLLQ